MMPPSIQAQLEERDSPLSRRLRSFVRPRADMAYRHWSQRHGSWRESEQLCRSFREPDAEDDARSRKSLTEGVRKIVVPYPYAIVQSTLAFFMSVFTQRKPIIPVEAEGAADVRAALLMEMTLGYQSNTMEPSFTMALFQALFDACRYGVGIVKNSWAVREWPDLKRTVTPIIDPFSGKQMGMQDQITRENVTAYEGNQVLNVSPFDFLPDPRRSMADFQRGEFVGQRFKLSWTEARHREAQGIYAGIEHVPRRNRGGDMFGANDGEANLTGLRTESDLDRIIDMTTTDTASNAGEPYMDGLEFYAFIDPGDLGLGGGGLGSAGGGGGVPSGGGAGGGGAPPPRRPVWRPTVR